MFCSKCGKEISDDSIFCYSCGSIILNVEKTDVSSLPSDNIDKPIISDMKEENTNDKKDNDPLYTSNTEKTLEDDTILETFLRDEKDKKRRKWGWGWVVLLFMYSSYYGKLKRDDNLHTIIIELLGFVIMLILYFWIRNYFRNFYNDYKPSLISGIISIFSIVFIVEILYYLFIRL
ncbi:MAG: zinc ribbon domain-containing protein [Smithellaceae bacterium]|jgi:DNA-directed RNA polymerase subunit RPC12/RpoP